MFPGKELTALLARHELSSYYYSSPIPRLERRGSIPLSLIALLLLHNFLHNLPLLSPDPNRTFHNFRASGSGDQRFFTALNSSIAGFWGSELDKCPVRIWCIRTLTALNRLECIFPLFCANFIDFFHGYRARLVKVHKRLFKATASLEPRTK